MAELPLPGYDSLTVGDLTTRIRSLSADEVQALLTHERAHADRAPVVTVLESRLDQLREGAPTSAGGAVETPPSDAPTSRGVVQSGGRSSAASPPPHGNPAQPARPKADAG